MEPVKYCEDCKWYRKKPSPYSPLCAHPEVHSENVVSRAAAALSCSYARTDFGTATTCGSNGQYWEPKEPVVKKPWWKL